MLCAQSGLSVRELGDLVESHGLATAIRLAAGRAELRSRGQRMVAARAMVARRMGERYETP